MFSIRSVESHDPAGPPLAWSTITCQRQRSWSRSKQNTATRPVRKRAKRPTSIIIWEPGQADQGPGKVVILGVS